MTERLDPYEIFADDDADIDLPTPARFELPREPRVSDAAPLDR
ncbi:hypothetical protein [Amycolatopsis samaneae]|uniref:Uncharacterized protein n=1 Tax=Amycolatopsis samaneae TaxID=664691 RepID=A0ABW5GTU5_9PSEU